VIVPGVFALVCLGDTGIRSHLSYGLLEVGERLTSSRRSTMP
jgi:hypothetical protein